jgi:hypothetical protein
MPAPLPNQTPEQALLSTRIVWMALLTAPLIVFGVLAPKIFSTQPRTANADSLLNILPFIVGAMAVIQLPVLYIVRAVIFRKRRVNDAVTPQGFLTGNLIFFAGCEGLMLFDAVSCMITQNAIPMVLPGVALLLAMLLNFPTGRAMYPDGELPNPYNPDAK